MTGRGGVVRTRDRRLEHRPRVLFYSHDGLGLGHLRITLAVAEALAGRLPGATRLLLTGSSFAGAFDLPEGLDYVKLPGIDKRHLFEPDPEADDPDGPGDVFALREPLIGAAVDAFAPHLLVVDQEPAGLAGELTPVLSRLRAAPRRPKLAVGLRDITFAPEQTRRQWTSQGVYSLLDELYDLILVYGCSEVFDPVREYGFSEAAAAKTVFAGYLRRPEPVRPAATVRAELGAEAAPLVVVSAGGGSDGAPPIGAFLAAVGAGLLPGVVASVVTGPQMPAGEVAELVAVAERLPGVRLARFRPDLVDQVAAADALVTMGGYNSVWEAVAAGKRPVIVPRPGGTGEQAIRAERLAVLGLATVLPPGELSPERLAAAVRAELARGTSPAPMVDFGGAERAGEALAGLLGEEERVPAAADRRWRFRPSVDAPAHGGEPRGSGRGW